MKMFTHHCYTADEAALVERDARRDGGIALSRFFGVIAALSVASLVVAVGIDISLGVGLLVIALGLAVAVHGRYYAAEDASRELAGLRPLSRRDIRRVERIAQHLPEVRHSLDRWKADSKVLRMRDYHAVIAHLEQ